jgi:hypothetical protein
LSEDNEKIPEVMPEPMQTPLPVEADDKGSTDNENPAGAHSATAGGASELESFTDADVAREKNRALVPLLRTFAEEMERRVANGELTREVGKMRTTQIMFHLGKLAQALKGPAVQIGIALPASPAKPQMLLSNSATKRTPGQLEAARRRARLQLKERTK